LTNYAADFSFPNPFEQLPYILKAYCWIQVWKTGAQKIAINGNARFLAKADSLGFCGFPI